MLEIANSWIVTISFWSRGFAHTSVRETIERAREERDEGH